MDTASLFARLRGGTRFDFKRFRAEAERFQMVKPTSDCQMSPVEAASALDFFGSKAKQAIHGGSVKKPPAGRGSGTSAPAVSGTAQKRKRGEGLGPSNGKKGKQSGRSGRKVEDAAGGNADECADIDTGLEEEEVEEVVEEDDEEEEEAVEAPADAAICTKKEEPEEELGIQLMSSLGKLPLKHKVKKKKKPSAEKAERIRRDQVNALRNSLKVHVSGTDVPPPLASFEQLRSEYELHPRILSNVLEAGYLQPTPVQRQAIPLMMQRREILACAPTGSGKTAAFCIPILHHLQQPRNCGFRAVIVSPTRELVAQTHRELSRIADGLGFRIHMITKTSVAAKKFGPKSAKRFDILVTTPNRLVFLIKQEPPVIDLSSVEWLIVDESDKLFEAGSSGSSGFREQLAAIFQACTSPAARHAMFSATFAQDVEQWSRLNLDNLVSVGVGTRNTPVETVEQELLFVGAESGKLLAIRNIVKKGLTPPVLVFVQSIQRARELFNELVYEGINVDVIHADRTKLQRDNIVRSFRAGKIWVLICTELMGRGMDFKGINLVINYDFPTSAIEYIHRIGRTGRAGKRGKAITFFTEDDRPLLRSTAAVIKKAGCPIPDYMMGLERMPSKTKRSLVKNPPKRETIRTMPELFLPNAARHKKTIAFQKQGGKNKVKTSS
ncbi:putative ATP-dependent RNA helicase DDX52 isoform X1 [Petromyzon marinus]|uniref:putative ATP-dependent RNA helicase DDX52 isoform X1 n=1 Tax=Petromyzon marinus TaxID=7757 RepID=UPI003F6F90B9